MIEMQLIDSNTNYLIQHRCIDTNLSLEVMLKNIEYYVISENINKRGEVLIRLRYLNKQDGNNLMKDFIPSTICPRLTINDLERIVAQS